MKRMMRIAFAVAVLACALLPLQAGEPGSNSTGFIRASADGQGFTLDGRPWYPFGCNYFDPHVGWAPKIWRKFDPAQVEEHFRVMRDLGVSVVRVFITAQSFFPSGETLEPEALAKFDKMIEFGRRYGIRIHPTGPDHWEGTPEWRKTDFYSDPKALAAQARFWELFAARYRDEPMIFAYDLLNEPHVRWTGPSMQAEWRKWLAAEYGTSESLRAAWGKEAESISSFESIAIPADEANVASRALLDYQHFREWVGDRWVRVQAEAIRTADPNHLVTVGLIQHAVPVISARPSTYAAVNPKRIAPFVDFQSVHFYPFFGDPSASDREVDQNRAYLELVLRYVKAGSPDKPLVVGEFGWHGGGVEKSSEFRIENQLKWCKAAIEQGRGLAAGWLNWGYADTPSSRDLTIFSGLVTENGEPKPWGLAFREFARNPESWTRGSSAPKAEFVFDLEKAVLDPQVGHRFLKEYYEAWQPEQGCRLVVEGS